MRHALTVGCLGVAVMLMASCSDEGGGLKPIPVVATQTSSAPGEDIAKAVGSPESSAPSVSTTLAPPTPVVVTPDKAEAILLSSDDVGRLVGATLTSEAKYSSPNPPSADENKCASLVGPNANTLGDEWTTYRDVFQKETEKRWSHIVWQAAALYPDAKTAAAQFPLVFPAELRSCDKARIDLTDGEFQFEAPNLGVNAGSWSMVQLDNGTPTIWRCFFDFRVKNNVIYGARLCQGGNGRPALTAIVDRMAEWIPA